MASTTLTSVEYNDRPRGAARRCVANWMDEGRCRRVAKTRVTVETVTSNEKVRVREESLMCEDCWDRMMANYVREFRSNLAENYFDALTVNGNAIKR